jgi:CHAD domain-containing protein
MMRPVVRPGFVVAGGAAHDLDELTVGVREALSTSFATSIPPGRRRLTRTWLDTFDWRLYRAGLTLQFQNDELILGELVQRTTNWRPPRTGAVTLPAGPIADRIASLIEPRTLLVAATSRSTHLALALLNADAKTVARVEFDVPDGQPARLTITGIRGYATAAARAADLLVAIPDIEPATLTALEAAAPRRPGEYTGKVGARITARQPAPAAIAVVLLDLLDTLEANVDGTVKDLDTEFLHDLRVSVRRTRSALKLLDNVLMKGEGVVGGDLTQAKAEFKWLGDVTTPVRDLDVHLLELGPDAGDLEPFRAHLARVRAKEKRVLTRQLRSERFAILVKEWRETLTAIRDAKQPAKVPAVGEVATATIAAARGKLLKKGAAITEESPPEDLHDLRKRGKELRYALEFFVSVYPAGTSLAELKRLQDVLGEFQDTQVQIDEIRAQAAAMLADRAHTVPASVFLAMGEVIGDLYRRQRAAREDFSRRYEKFARS